MKRHTIAAAVLTLVLVSAIGGWLGDTLIQSPAEVAARRAPPEPSPILVPVEERALSTDVVSRGTARFGSPETLSLISTRLKSGRQRVTRLPALGTKFVEGDVLLTVSGRPVFLFEGSEPSYRDLGPGIEGNDVRQLEAAMKRIGLDPGRVDGVFDRKTERAVATLYSREGFDPLRATEDQLAAVRPLEAELLDNARARPGVQLPADEVIFVPNTPVRVTKLPLDPGDPPSGPIMTVTDVIVAIDSAVPLEEARLVKRGMKVRIDEPDLGIKAAGVVSEVAKTPGTDGADQFQVHFSVRVKRVPPTLVGASVRLTIPVKSTKGSVLAVPVSALSLASDGSSRVQRATGSGLEFVRVEPGLSAGGFVEVTPIGGTLEPRDLVVVGFKGRTDVGA